MSGICATIQSGKFRSILEAMMEADVSIEDKDQTAILIWHDALRDCDFFGPMKAWQVVNRIPSINILCRKVPYSRVIQRMQGKFPKLYNFMPKTYVLPIQRETLAEELRKKESMFLFKPDSGSLGHGIIVLNSEEDLNHASEKLAVAQEYIDSFLIDGTKFDLRLYVLIASLEPLRVYVYRNGLARFCSEKAEKGTPFSQFTNVSLNSENPDADISEISQLVSDIFPRMAKMGIDIDAIWERIDSVVVSTIIAAHEFLVRSEAVYCPKIGYSRCFHLLGFDILLDKKLNPWVLEVNNRPSLDYYRGKERRMKVGAIRDAIKLACPLQHAQMALSARKWSWTEETWKTFISETPSILEDLEVTRSDVEKNTLFHLAYPSNHPNREEWDKALEYTRKLPLELLHGLKLPESQLLALKSYF